MKKRSTKQPLEKALGLEVLLRDGTRIIVNSISHSFRYPNLAVINEEHFVDYLELFAQIEGEELTEEDRDVWREMIKDLKTKKVK